MKIFQLGAAIFILAGCVQKNVNLKPQSSATDFPVRAIPLNDYLAVGQTYPTGKFDPNWIMQAEVSDRKILNARPFGDQMNIEKTANLNLNAFTYLGPAPIFAGTDRNTGRIRDIVISPQPLNPNVANSYRAYVGTAGGIWRTDECCTLFTTWAPISDDPAIRATSIGDLEMDPTNSNIIYAGTGDLRFGTYTFSSFGLLKTIDGGNSWRVLGSNIFTPDYPAELTSYPQTQAISKVVLDPNNNNRIFVGTKTGVYISSDAGENFVGPCYTNGFAPPNPNRQRQDITGLLAINRNGVTELIAAVGTRGKATPIQPDLDLNGANGVYRTNVTSPGCPTNWSLISRSDNGWPDRTGDGNAFGPIGRIELAIAPSNNNVIYAATVDPIAFTVLGVWQTLDGGNNWLKRSARVSNAGAASSGGQAPCGTGDQNWYNFGLSVAPDNEQTLFLSSWWLGRSLDGGENFVSLGCSENSEAYHIDQHARSFVGQSTNRMVIGNDGGVYFSDDIRAATPNFTAMNGDLGVVEFYGGDLSANFATSTTRTIIGGAQDNGTSVLTQSGDAQSAPWTKIFGADGITARIEPILAQRVYYSSQNGRMYVSTNGANRHEFSADGPWVDTATNEAKSFLTVFDLYRYGNVDVANSGCTRTGGCTNLLYGSNRIWESTNGAIGNQTSDRFQAISPNLTKNTLIIGTDIRSVVNSVAYSYSSNKIAIAGTVDGNVWYGFDLAQRPARNANWVNVTDNNRVLPNRTITKVNTDPNNALIAYVSLNGFDANTPSTPGHVYQIRCSNNCASFQWKNVSGNLPNIPAHSVIVNPHNSKQVFVGTEWGLYFTDAVDDDYPIWKRFEGMPRVSIWDMQIDRGFTTLAIFTRARGAWVWPLARVENERNLNGIWSNTNEPGWGMSIAHQGQTIFPVWYSYDVNQIPSWLLVSGAAKQIDGSFTGDIFRVTGTPFASILNSNAVVTTQNVGNAKFSPLANGDLQFDYSVDGISQTKRLSRLVVPPLASCSFTSQPRTQAKNFSDIWWNESEPGWGLHILQSDSILFLTWYTYRNDGSAMWVTGQLDRDSSGSFSGDLNRPLSGVAFNQINGPATTFPVPSVGQASLQFSSGENGVFTYTLDGITQSKPISRFIYSSPPLSVCE